MPRNPFAYAVREDGKHCPALLIGASGRALVIDIGDEGGTGYIVIDALPYDESAAPETWHYPGASECPVCASMGAVVRTLSSN